MRTPRRSRRIRAAPLLLAALLGCVPQGGGPADTLRINLLGEPPTLDWNRATDSTSIMVIEQLMRGLTRLGPGLRPAPALAERWESEQGGRIWRFHLRRDVVWSDGVPLEASHFVDGWRRLLAPATAAEYAYYLYPVRGARALNSGESRDPELGVRALDRHTLEVELEQPLVFFPSLVNFMVTFPIRLDLIERHGEAWTDPGRLVSLGPYVLADWHHEYRVSLRINPLFFGTEPGPKRILAYMVQDPATQLVLFEQGYLDWVRLPPLEIRRYVDRPQYRTGPMLRGYYYGFDVREPPFDDVRVRRAFALAVDRDVFPAVLQGGEVPWSSWIPPGMPAANAGIGLRFDPEQARALLADAGIDPAELGPIALGYNTGETRHKLVAEKVQSMWAEHLGVEVALQPREWKVYLKELVIDPPPIYRMGWGADYPDPHNFMELFTSYSANNYTGWQDAGYDALIAEASRATDPATRQRLYDDAQRILCERDVPIIPFFVSAANLVVSERVRGFETSPMDLYYFDEVRLE
jgi:oligopeptide transport system substrate-binding protein